VATSRCDVHVYSIDIHVHVHRVITKALASPPENNRYYLVYWPEEQSVSSVRSDGITSPSLVDLKVGVDCML